MNSYAVRCVVQLPKKESNERSFLYEERITVWRAVDIDEAIEKAEKEVADYSKQNGFLFAGLSQAYWMFSQIELDGVEVFSLLRESHLPTEEYLDAFFSTGNERETCKRV